MLRLGCLILLILQSPLIFAVDRPKIEFDGVTYVLSDYLYYNTSIEEIYLPENEQYHNWTKRIERVELFDVFSIKAASDGLAYDAQDLSLPSQIVHDADHTILKVTHHSPTHPVVLDKEITIFKQSPINKRVVYYTYTQREFNDPAVRSIDAIKQNHQAILIEDAFAKKIKQLKID